MVSEGIRFSEFINIWVKDAPESVLELAELVGGELAVSVADGCCLADEKLGRKSSCFSCPFDDCLLGEEGWDVGGLPSVVDEMGSEYARRKRIRNHLGNGRRRVCVECRRWLNHTDDVYRRLNDKRCRCWCEACCAAEMVCLLHLRLCLGNSIMKVRGYERVWKSDLTKSVK